MNYAVTGTPNRLEYDQGFYVKGGDGLADVKPIAHLYKTQVYAMAKHLGLPAEICNRAPTTDTYSLAQGQDEFYFSLPYAQMDLALWAKNHGIAPIEAAPVIGITAEHCERVYKDIDQKRVTDAPARPQGPALRRGSRDQALRTVRDFAHGAMALRVLRDRGGLARRA